MIRFILSLIMIIILFSPTAYAIEEKPRWTLEMNMGLFEPRDENWSTYYGSDRMWTIGGSLAYRVLNVLDLGVSMDYGQDRGVGILPMSGLQDGEVVYSAIPINVFALLRLRFSEGQWIVPYGGGGYTRFAYHQRIIGQGSSRGAINGIHARAGLQLLLDPLDESAAREMLNTFGAINSYIYFEVKRTHAKTGNPAVQLGGYSFKSGLMVEFR